MSNCHVPTITRIVMSRLFEQPLFELWLRTGTFSFEMLICTEMWAMYNANWFFHSLDPDHRSPGRQIFYLLAVTTSNAVGAFQIFSDRQNFVFHIFLVSVQTFRTFHSIEELFRTNFRPNVASELTLFCSTVLSRPGLVLQLDFQTALAKQPLRLRRSRARAGIRTEANFIFRFRRLVDDNSTETEKVFLPPPETRFHFFPDHLRTICASRDRSNEPNFTCNL